MKKILLILGIIVSIVLFNSVKAQCDDQCFNDVLYSKNLNSLSDLTPSQQDEYFNSLNVDDYTPININHGLDFFSENPTHGKLPTFLKAQGIETNFVGNVKGFDHGSLIGENMRISTFDYKDTDKIIEIDKLGNIHIIDKGTKLSISGKGGLKKEEFYDEVIGEQENGDIPKLSYSADGDRYTFEGEGEIFGKPIKNAEFKVLPNGKIEITAREFNDIKFGQITTFNYDTNKDLLTCHRCVIISAKNNGMSIEGTVLRGNLRGKNGKNEYEIIELLYKNHGSNKLKLIEPEKWGRELIADKNKEFKIIWNNFENPNTKKVKSFLSEKNTKIVEDLIKKVHGFTSDIFGGVQSINIDTKGDSIEPEPIGLKINPIHPGIGFIDLKGFINAQNNPGIYYDGIKILREIREFNDGIKILREIREFKGPPPPVIDVVRDSGGTLINDPTKKLYYINNHGKLTLTLKQGGLPPTPKI